MTVSLRHLLGATAAFLFTGAAQADYVWLQRDADALGAYAGELAKPLAALPALQSPKAARADGTALAVTPQAGHLDVGAAPGTGDVRFTAQRAVATSSGGVLTYYQAKFGRAETKAVNDLELVPTEPHGNTYQLVFKGRPVAASQVNVETSEGWRRVLTPGKDGTVSFTPYFPGLYVLEVSARVNNGSVTLDGTKYDDVRHTATLSFEVVK